MTRSAGHSTLANWLDLERAHMAAASARWRAGAEQFREQVERAATNLAHRAGCMDATQAALDLKPRPPIDVAACLAKLRSEGPLALSPRELRGLLSLPHQVPAADADRILHETPALIRHVVRACLSQWFQTRAQPWGREYVELLARRAATSGLPMLEHPPLPVRRLLSVGNASGDTQLGAALSQTSVVDAYNTLRELGLRESWQYTGEVLAAWLEQQAAQCRPLDPLFAEIRSHERVRALLLPLSNSATTPPAGVRVEALTHAKVVATLLQAGYAQAALLSRPRLSELADDLLRSQFGDPRLPPLSQGWQLVSQLVGDVFRQFLSSLSEQDLEVFFKHAMNEPDRRKFWTGYLGSIERTGCVLDKDSQQRLKERLQASPELSGAISRSYRFALSSGVQAFFLVFARVVVVEFSDTGNAAYVYDRTYFESNLEKAIRSSRVDNALGLKRRSNCMHRITHTSGWEGKAAQWLAEQGIHRRSPGGRSRVPVTQT